MLPGITQTQIDNVKAFIKKSELNEEPTRNVQLPQASSMPKPSTMKNYNFEKLLNKPQKDVSIKQRRKLPQELKEEKNKSPPQITGGWKVKEHEFSLSSLGGEISAQEKMFRETKREGQVEEKKKKQPLKKRQHVFEIDLTKTRNQNLEATQYEDSFEAYQDSAEATVRSNNFNYRELQPKLTTLQSADSESTEKLHEMNVYENLETPLFKKESPKKKASAKNKKTWSQPKLKQTTTSMPVKQ